MKIIFFIMYLIFLTNCSGYSPVFTSSKINFYIEEISFSENDKLLRKISKNLKPYSNFFKTTSHRPGACEA